MTAAPAFHVDVEQLERWLLAATLGWARQIAAANPAHRPAVMADTTPELVETVVWLWERDRVLLHRVWQQLLVELIAHARSCGTTPVEKWDLLAGLRLALPTSVDRHQVITVLSGHPWAEAAA